MKEDSRKALRSLSGSRNRVSDAINAILVFFVLYYSWIQQQLFFPVFCLSKRDRRRPLAHGVGWGYRHMYTALVIRSGRRAGAIDARCSSSSSTYIPLVSWRLRVPIRRITTCFSSSQVRGAGRDEPTPIMIVTEPITVVPEGVPFGY